jgi:hypothetical protein
MFLKWKLKLRLKKKLLAPVRPLSSVDHLTQVYPGYRLIRPSLGQSKAADQRMGLCEVESIQEIRGESRAQLALFS